MAGVSIGELKALRERTGAGVMECRRALEESGGKMEKAVELLRQAGLERAEKKASEREVRAGRVFAYVHHTGTVGAMVVVASETDFVARLDEVKTLGEEIAKQVCAMNPTSVDELLKQAYIRDPGKTIDGLVKEISGKTGEKIVVADFRRVEV